MIGSTGAGKSTLVNLVPRLFDATAGTVRGRRAVDVRDLDPDAALGASSGWCRRRRTCSAARSRSNLRHGKPDATDEELWAALEVAQAPRLRRGRCPRGSTPRSARAAPTSPAASGSGWRSRGRWYAGPAIYLFDDSFSALDLATDARLRAALKPGDHRRDRA